MRTTLLAVAGAVALAGSPPARAAETPNEARLREALRSAAAQVRTLEDERAALQASEAAMKKAVEALRAELQVARRPAAAPSGESRKLAELKQALDEQAAAVARQTEALARCEASGKDSAELGKAIEAERARLSASNGNLYDRVVSCEARNSRLYRVGKDVIDWLAGMGVAKALAAREPFLGLKRVELENTAQDYEDKLLEHKVRP